MSVPTTVTTSIIITESGSSAKAKSTEKRPAVNMFQSVCWRKRSSAGSALSWTNEYTATANEAIMAATAMKWTSCLPRPPFIDLGSPKSPCSFQPMSALMVAPSSGKSGMSQSQVACVTRIGASWVRFVSHVTPASGPRSGRRWS